MMPGWGNAVARDFKSALSDGYSQSRRQDPNGHFQSMVNTLIEAAGIDLANKPATVQVQKIINFFKDTMPAS